MCVTGCHKSIITIFTFIIFFKKKNYVSDLDMEKFLFNLSVLTSFETWQKCTSDFEEIFFYRVIHNKTNFFANRYFIETLWSIIDEAGVVKLIVWMWN